MIFSFLGVATVPFFATCPAPISSVLVEVTRQTGRVAAIAGHSTAVFHLLRDGEVAGKSKPSGTILGAHPMYIQYNLI